VIKTEGLPSLWKGNGINTLKIFPKNALDLALKDFFSRFIRADAKNKGRYLMASMISGGCAGAFTISAIYPLDFARTRFSSDQHSGKKASFKGLFDCLEKTIRKEGIKGCYYGITTALCGVFLSRGIILGCYDYTKTCMF